MNINKPSQRYFLNIFTSRLFLNLIAEGVYQAKIAMKLGWSKQRVNYWFSKLEREGMIREEARSNIKTFQVTSRGKELLTWSEALFEWRVFVHSLGLKFPVVETNPDFDRLDWTMVPLKNWIKKTLKYHGIECDYSLERTPRNLLIWCRERSGVHPYELFFESVRDLLEFAASLQSRYGITLGSPSLVRKPHFGLVDPLFVRVNKEVQVSGPEEWTDNSPAPGSAEFFDPKRIVSYLRMPEKVDDMAKQLAEITEVLSVFGEGMKEHMTLVSSLQEVAYSLKEAVDLFTHFSSLQRLT